MDEILQANIFFFIASLATVVFIVFISIILFHVIKISKSIRSIVEKVEAGSEVLSDDIAELRSYVLNGGFISRLLGLFLSLGQSGNKRQTKRRTTTRSRKGKTEEGDDSQ